METTEQTARPSYEGPDTIIAVPPMTDERRAELEKRFHELCSDERYIDAAKAHLDKVLAHLKGPDHD